MPTVQPKLTKTDILAIEESVVCATKTIELLNQQLAPLPMLNTTLPTDLRDYYATLWLNLSQLARTALRAEGFLKTFGHFQGIADEQPRRKPHV